MTDASPRQSLASIARALGVSTATVSNAFNKPERVSDELRARVLDHARKVGYVGPDPAARHLRRGRSDVVGLVFSDNLELRSRIERHWASSPLVSRVRAVAATS